MRTPTRTWWGIAAAVVGIAVCVLPARADTITTVPDITTLTPTYTLLEANSLAGGLHVGNMMFTNFFLDPPATLGGALAPTMASINVTGIEANFAGRVEYGIVLNSLWSVGGGQFVDTVLHYNLTADSPALISDSTLWMVGSGRGGGNAAITEVVTGNQLVLANTYVFNNDTQTQGNIDHVIFPEGAQSVSIIKDIGVTGGTDVENGHASISVIYQTFSQTPEPLTLVTLAIGALGIFRRRRARQA